MITMTTQAIKFRYLIFTIKFLYLYLLLIFTILYLIFYYQLVCLYTITITELQMDLAVKHQLSQVMCLGAYSS